MMGRHHRMSMGPLALLTVMAAGCSDYLVHPKNEPPPGDTAPPDCADFDPGELASVTVDESCLREPGVGTFQPEVEWQWNTNPILPAYDDIMAAPAVGNLNDDNQDGLVNGADTPEVVFTTFSGGAYSSAGALNAVIGDGSGTLWSIFEAGGHGFYGAGGVALGDLEGDGTIEVCAAGTTAAVVCVNGSDGSFLWAGGSETKAYGCPAIADLDGDGSAEVIFGRQVFDAAGNLLFVGTEGFGGPHRMSFAVDWDGDGQLEVVAGRTVYELDGSILWNDPANDHAAAVGDFNGDGDPDLVRSGDGVVRLTFNDGTEGWSTAIPGGGNGGPPTVADFDGDGEPEVGVAGSGQYSLFETDGTVRWSNSTQDLSSSQTGSSVFDFEGDGAAEVVHADELNLWIYNGSDGQVRLQLDGHASGTLMEYPLVADVDNDDSSEIILVGNDYTFTGWNGVTVIGDVDGSWAPARPIWNQYSYHITNVNNDGSIPAVQVENWLTWNNFRAAGTELGPAHWQANVRVDDPAICTARCREEAVEIHVPLSNTGRIDAVDFDLVLQGGAEVARETIPGLRSGGARWFGPYTVSRQEWGSGHLLVRGDADDVLDECNEVDNLVNLGSWPCP